MSPEPASPLVLTTLLFGPLLLGIFQQLVTEPPARTWHRGLHKSPYRPPPFVFPLAWIWSYLSMGYASLVVYERVAPGPALYAVAAGYLLHQALLNTWGPLFFLARRMDWALNVMVMLDVVVAVLLIAISALVPFAAVLCLPYFCWLLELTYLNVFMFRNNDQAVVGWGAQTKEQIVAAHLAPVVEVDADREKEE